MSEVFAYVPKGILEKKLRAKAAEVLHASEWDILLTTPAITYDDEVVFSYNGNRHLGDIDTVGLNA